MLLRLVGMLDLFALTSVSVPISFSLIKYVRRWSTLLLLVRFANRWRVFKLLQSVFCSLFPFRIKFGKMFQWISLLDSQIRVISLLLWSWLTALPSMAIFLHSRVISRAPWLHPLPFTTLYAFMVLHAPMQVIVIRFSWVPFRRNYIVYRELNCVHLVLTIYTLMAKRRF